MDIKSRADINLDKKEDENRKHLINVLTAFSHVAQTPVTFFDEESRATWDCLSDQKICSMFPNYNHCNEQCMENLKRSLKIAFQLGEPYIFLCSAGLIKIAYPFTVNGQQKGGFFAGPLVMGSRRDNVIKRLMKHLPFSKEYAQPLVSYLSDLKIHSPKEISYIYEVFCNSAFSARILEKDYGMIPKAANDNFQEQLLQSMKSGDEEHALKSFRQLYEKIYVLEAGNLSAVKTQLMELSSILSKTITGDRMESSIYLEDLEKLHNAFTFSQTFELANHLISKLTKIAAFSAHKDGSPIVQKAARYIEEHFKDNITLNGTAASAGTNASYLSTQFKTETGLTFSKYLTQIRLNHSLKLLSETHLSITEIALTSGFSNQSYFIKVFRENMETTPGEYRKKLLGAQKTLVFTR